MSDTWDDSDDEWDRDDDELDARLNKLGINNNNKDAPPTFDDEEDLALIEKAQAEKLASQELKKKGNALVAKKQAELERMEEEELARKAMEMEAELEANLSPDQLRALKQQQIEEADHALTDDLFGGVDTISQAKSAAVAAGAGPLSDKVVLKDLKDHLKHARKVAAAIKQHGKIHLATAFLKEAIQECKDVLDDDAITDIIKTCNVIKNEKVQASKKKVKYQAQKAAKRDKAAEAKARQLQTELYGNNDAYDEYDQMGHDYEDSFF